MEKFQVCGQNWKNKNSSNNSFLNSHKFSCIFHLSEIYSILPIIFLPFKITIVENFITFFDKIFFITREKVTEFDWTNNLTIFPLSYVLSWNRLWWLSPSWFNFCQVNTNSVRKHNKVEIDWPINIQKLKIYSYSLLILWKKNSIDKIWNWEKGDLYVYLCYIFLPYLQLMIRLVQCTKPIIDYIARKKNANNEDIHDMEWTHVF